MENSRPRLWILDIPSDYRMICSALAERYGFETAPLDCLAQAWRLLEAGERPDFVIVGLELPDGNPLEWVRALRVRVPEARVVCWSETPNPPLSYHLLLAGVHWFRKPGSLLELLELFRRSD